MEFFILQRDITVSAMDAIVNAANTSLLGRGGVDGTIRRAAGPELLEECRRLHGYETGHTRIASGYRLPINCVIHTLGPVWHGGGAGEKGLLASCYQSCLQPAEENGCHAVTFPSISTGVYRFPLECAVYIAMQETLAFSRTAKTVQSIIVVRFDERTKAAYEAALRHAQQG